MLSASSRRRWLKRDGPRLVGGDSGWDSNSATGMQNLVIDQVLKAGRQKRRPGGSAMGCVFWIGLDKDSETTAYTRRKCSTGNNRSGFGWPGPSLRTS